MEGVLKNLRKINTLITIINKRKGQKRLESEGSLGGGAWVGMAHAWQLLWLGGPFGHPNAPFFYLATVFLTHFACLCVWKKSVEDPLRWTLFFFFEGVLVGLSHSPNIPWPPLFEIQMNPNFIAADANVEVNFVFLHFLEFVWTVLSERGSWSWNSGFKI